VDHALPTYSDLGFALLGRALEAAAGMPIEAWLRANVLDPLGMADTGYTFTGTRARHRARHRALTARSGGAGARGAVRCAGMVVPGSRLGGARRPDALHAGGHGPLSRVSTERAARLRADERRRRAADARAARVAAARLDVRRRRQRLRRGARRWARPVCACARV
jgi:CubicO group peptidase (beta-lactamase class C family)